MLDEFRRLPPIARIGLILGGIAVIIGIGVLLTFALSGQKSGTGPGGLPAGSSSPTPSATGSATVDPSTIPLPTAPPSTAVPTPITDGTVNKTISDDEKARAYIRAQKGVQEWCTYNKKESKAAHLRRIQPYFTANNPESNGSEYIDLIQDQSCIIHQGEPQNILSKTSMTILIYATTVTIYNGDVGGSTTTDPNKPQQSVARDTQIYITADKVNGTWLISKLESN